MVVTIIEYRADFTVSIVCHIVVEVSWLQQLWFGRLVLALQSFRFYYLEGEKLKVQLLALALAGEPLVKMAEMEAKGKVYEPKGCK